MHTKPELSIVPKDANVSGGEKIQFRLFLDNDEIDPALAVWSSRENAIDNGVYTAPYKTVIDTVGASYIEHSASAIVRIRKPELVIEPDSVKLRLDLGETSVQLNALLDEKDVTNDVIWNAKHGTINNGLYEQDKLGEDSVTATLSGTPLADTIIVKTISPWLAISQLDKNESIYVVFTDGSKKLITNEGQNLGLHFSPNGKKIAFDSNRSITETQIYISDLDGNVEQITDFDNTHDPDWSPDGNQLVFWGTETFTSGFDIYKIDIRSGIFTRLTQERKSGGKVPSSPAWSPDGRSIVYQYIDKKNKNNWEIWRMDLDGSNVENVTKSPETNEFMPRFSPDGTKISFVRGPEGGNEWALHIMNPDGKADEQLSSIKGISSYAWSPNGRYIAVIYDADHDSVIATIDSQTGETVNT